MSQALLYPFAAPPAVGLRQAVAPGIEWLRLPLPFDFDHVNVYLLRDGAHWLLLDTGLNVAETRDIWPRVLAGLPGGGTVSRVVVTHAHPDHVGLAGWLHQRLGARLSMSEAEWRMLSHRDTGHAARVAAYWRRAGAPAAMVEWACARPAATH
ncbi:MBL fold metallo-hydrolase, partial [Thauera linaloolentis]